MDDVMTDYRRRQEAARLNDRRRLDEIAQAAGQGRIAVVDALGRAVQVGDFVTVQALPQATIFRVAKLEPILAHPQMAGMIEVTFASEMTMVLPSGQPQGLIIVAPAEATPVQVQPGQPELPAAAPATDSAASDAPVGPRLVSLTD